MNAAVRKLVALVVTAALLVLGLMFSALLFAFIAAAGAIALGYFWWKTRALRRQIRERAAAGMVAEEFKGEVFRGEVIEGEVVRKVVSIDVTDR